jgi:hypothetical protein
MTEVRDILKAWFASVRVDLDARRQPVRMVGISEYCRKQGESQYPVHDMSDTITLFAWFEPEETVLMRRCLEAVVSDRFFDDDLLHTLTGWRTETFRNLLDQFDRLTSTTGSTSREDYEIIFQAVMQLSNYPIANPEELESLLEIPLLYFSWFWYKLRAIRDDWEHYVEDNATQARWKSLQRF